MKYSFILKMFLTVTTSLTFMGVAKPTMAQSSQYSCSLDNRQLTTIADTVNGKVKLIEWNKIASILNTGEKELTANCLEVSSKLQDIVVSGKPYVSLGRLSENDYFLCTANASGDCEGENFGFLLMLKSDTEPQTALKQIFGFPVEHNFKKEKVAINLNQLISERTQTALNNNQDNSNSYRQYPVKLPQASYNTQSSDQILTANVPTKISEPTQPNTDNTYFSRNLARDQYRCENNQTIVHTRRGKIQLIVWKSDFFANSGYTPEERCQMVSNRFQRFSDAKKLRFLSTGNMNNQPVICISDRSGNCIRNGLLLTLEPSDNPEQVLHDLFDISARISGGGVSRADRDKTVVDFRQLLYASFSLPNGADSTPQNSIGGGTRFKPNSEINPL